MHIVYLSPGFPGQNKRMPGCFRHSLLWVSLLQGLFYPNGKGNYSTVRFVIGLKILRHFRN